MSWYNSFIRSFGLEYRIEAQWCDCPDSLWSFLHPGTHTTPSLIPVALASRLWEVSELLHWKLCYSWVPYICEGQCGRKGAPQPLSPHSASWAENQSVRHPWGGAWSVERGVRSAAGSELWPLRGPDHRRWRGGQQWILLAGEKHLPVPCPLWVGGPTYMLACAREQYG